jgi:hypothetical protein
VLLLTLALTAGLSWISVLPPLTLALVAGLRWISLLPLTMC